MWAKDNRPHMFPLRPSEQVEEDDGEEENQGGEYTIEFSIMITTRFIGEGNISIGAETERKIGAIRVS